MGLERFLRRADWDRERQREIESYLQIETDENVSRGLSHADAVDAARRKLGNATRVREEIYGMNSIAPLETLLRDLRCSLRTLRHNPTFTAVVLITLAIGIGANTAVFAVLNCILLRPLAYPKPNELIALRQLAPGANGLATLADGLLLSPSMYMTYAEHNRSFQSMGIWITDIANVTGVAEPEQVRTAIVSDGVLQTLRIAPLVGRCLSANDQIPDGPKTVMLSYGYWQRRFGGEASAIGRVIRVDSESRQIVGVMPPQFRLVDADFDLIVPAAFDRRKLTLAEFGYQGLARLKPGITIAQANADLSRMLPIWMDSWSNGPGTNSHFYKQWRITPTIRLLKDDLVGNVRDVLWVVMGTIGLVMLMAAANVTNLFLVRNEARQQELAVRAALGAGWGRIARELLVESSILGLIGGGLAVALAYEGISLLVRIGPATLPRLNEISLDGWAIALALLLSLGTSVVCGSIGALKYARPPVLGALRSAGRTSTPSVTRYRARNILAIAQVAMALVLLVSAGLMIRTFRALESVDPGFTDGNHLQTMRTYIPPSLVADAERVARMQQAIVQRLSAIPGVASAAYTDGMPMEGFGSDWDEIYAENVERTRTTPPLRLYKYASPQFFHTAGTRVIAGREITWAEIYGQRPEVLISENLARELWGTPAAAVGKHLKEFKAMPWYEVIGVVQNTRENGVDKEAPPIVYWPPLMEYLFGRKKLEAIRAITFVIRTPRAGKESLRHELQQAVWSVEPSLPVASVQTMQDIYGRSLSRTSFAMTVLGIAAVFALVLGIVGIYGVVSYAVSLRRREIGIRLAVGAQPTTVRRMFVRSGLVLAGIGGAIGLLAAVGLTGLMKSLLFGISPLDPLTYVTTPLILAAAAAIASYLPARRAAALDPVQTLRAE